MVKIDVENKELVIEDSKCPYYELKRPHRKKAMPNSSEILHYPEIRSSQDYDDSTI